ncbi:hypothetical protein KV557_24720 [Kitasatospora aureofaciens]|uniref:hypothetical protein n=1 Tax=Kitasatospora aureofaciens TaxID=1894 RepID=UPI001C45FF4B|nr:hypothetical protein [Kitasatospora aureofaciens]MBV6700269.1 hypothetical protein [Kitasatospora aureofaciens]
MSESTPNLGPAGAGDEPEDDITRLFEKGFADLEKAMADAASVTTTGRSGATIGTFREPAPAQDVPEPVAVQAPPAAAGGLKAHALRALPDWMVSPEVRASLARYHRDQLVYRVIFHGVRSPKYLAKVMGLAARGAWVVVRDSVHLLWAMEYNRELRQAKKDGDDARIGELRDEKAQVAAKAWKSRRTLAAAIGGSLYLGAVLITAALGQWIVADPLLAALLTTLAVVGHRDKTSTPGGADYQILADLPAEGGPIGDTRIIGALKTAGLLRDGVEAVPVGHAEYHADGSAVHTYNLSGGLTVDEVAARTKKIAGLLRLPDDQIEITRGQHESQVVVWTSKRNPFAAARTSPLFGKNGKIEKTDIWNVGAPVGFDRRGATRYLWLRHVMALLGGMSQTGKGMLLRNIIPALALDPRVNIRLASAAKAAELMVFAPVCATFFGGRGSVPRFRELLRAFLAEAIRRDDFMVENGITRFTEESLKLFPLEILIADEAQLFTLDAETRELLEEISGFAASLNMGVLLVTQDPDTSAIPPKFNKNTKSRLATRTANDKQTNAILGARATGMGLVAHELSVDIPGMTIADCAGAIGVLLRSFFQEDRKFDAVAPLIAAAVEFRAEAGRLPGQFEDPIEAHLIKAFGTTSAAGGPRGMGRPGPVAQAEAPFLVLLRQVFERAGVQELRSSDIAILLSVLDPAGDWGQRTEENSRAWSTRAGGRLREAIEQATGRKIDTVPVVGPDGKKGNGYRLADLDAANDA